MTKELFEKMCELEYDDLAELLKEARRKKGVKMFEEWDGKE